MGAGKLLHPHKMSGGPPAAQNAIRVPPDINGNDGRVTGKMQLSDRERMTFFLSLPCRASASRPPELGANPDRSFLRGRPHREVSFRRRSALAFISSLMSAAGRISMSPQPSLSPGLCEMS